MAFTLLFLLEACNNSERGQEKFDKIKWNEREDPAFPPASRIHMINDLTTNNKLVGLTYNQLNFFLGTPDFAAQHLQTLL